MVQAISFQPSTQSLLCQAILNVIDDPILENTETFSLLLTSDDPGVSIFRAHASVAILDNDGR